MFYKNSQGICLKGFKIRQKSHYKCYKLKSKEAYLEGGSHMVLRVSWGSGRAPVPTWAGFRVPGAVGEGANNHKNPEIKHSLNYYIHQQYTVIKRKFATIGSSL